MNYKQLEAFRAVMEAGTVTGASDLLHIAQPSVSAHISNLEHALKIPLFIRRAGRLVPTAEAMLLNEEVGRGSSREWRGYGAWLGTSGNWKPGD
ncbi:MULTISPECIES: LysR family transcriptional regulator [Mesorhizobium]|uniref:LysR family transcriptional regulator n=1 Tax=Mesorhizobium TaxID=68287 RepID=UPI0010A9641A|nr:MULTISPECIES: LysR family transcriptional regulator [Mesorhizobium]